MGRARIKNIDLIKWKQARISLLQETIDLFEKYNIKYWVDSGSLLGLIRDGEIIDHDTDHDFCIKIENIDENFIAMFDEISKSSKYDGSVNDPLNRRYKKAFETKEIIPPTSFHKIQLSKRFVTQHNKILKLYSDVQILFPYDNFYFYRQNIFTWRYKKEHIENFTTICKYDRNIRVPEKSKEYLDIQYNYMWRTSMRFNAYKTNYWCNWREGKETLKSYKYNLKINA